MHANNEIGTIPPLAATGKICKKRRICFHADAAQATGKIPVDVDGLGADLLSIAEHKVHAPKEVGVFYVREGVVQEPLLHGANRESGRRAGTENVAGIVGRGKTRQMAHEKMNEYNEKISDLRELLYEKPRIIDKIKKEA